jgi:hypothetical protein
VTAEVEFREDTAWRGPGAPRVVIPGQVAAWMERTYREGIVCELPAQEHHVETEELIRLLKIYAARTGKSVLIQFFVKDDTEHLRFKMRDKRPYNRTTGLARERR